MPLVRITNPDYKPDPEDMVPGHEISGSGNPNIIAGGWDFPADLGMSRADLYPAPHENTRRVRFLKRWIY